MSKFAIRLKNIIKSYQIYDNQRDHMIDVLGLNKFGFSLNKPKEFLALKNISLDVKRGQRIGIVGPNGAGKTTLLKLLCSNFSPTSGTVEVNGSVQALMDTGLGFHPEFTGAENIEASLQYNALNNIDRKKATQSIVDFCELGDFLYQPFKTYSLGMQARLMFAVSTAINPDILIVDEILNAGDAFFIAKSKKRVTDLVSNGCTMLLVSHSLPQILELCDYAIWLENGSIKMFDESFLVVKAYEESVYGRINSAGLKIQEQVTVSESDILTKHNDNEAQNFSNKSIGKARFSLPDRINLQFPKFIPHQMDQNLPNYKKKLKEFNHIAKGGLSRWDSEVGLKITGFKIQSENGFGNVLYSMKPVKLIIGITSEITRKFSVIYGVVFSDMKGQDIIRCWSQPDKFKLKKNCSKNTEILFNPLQLGAGEYTIGLSMHEEAPIERIGSAVRYDLLNRSFKCNVKLHASHSALEAKFMHTTEWKF
jgi:lipopolysaccharide transport system ATP-binding protein